MAWATLPHQNALTHARWSVRRCPRSRLRPSYRTLWHGSVPCPRLQVSRCALSSSCVSANGYVSFGSTCPDVRAHSRAIPPSRPLMYAATPEALQIPSLLISGLSGHRRDIDIPVAGRDSPSTRGSVRHHRQKIVGRKDHEVSRGRAGLIVGWDIAVPESKVGAAVGAHAHRPRRDGADQVSRTSMHDCREAEEVAVE